ncbi:YveK family protein [Rummeliibacillus pycnus]|uniref:YveK family protein n=1 Tax=Rummeliibacillus pycnus TaxID=101070 RepID=UPI000C99A720|nr:Wzz/FepE/Etk N-terminal domain-containing protein [Rummeliibacillus pycnus]
MEATIKLSDLFKILKAHLFLIIAITVVSVSIATIISYFVLTPIYTADTQILVNQKSDKKDPYVASSQIDADLQMINTYNVVIKSPLILSKVIEKLDLNSTPETLTNQITILNTNNSQVFTVHVEDAKASQAVDISNTIAEIFKSEIPTLMKVDNINILSYAKLSEHPIPAKPNKLLNIGISGIIGLMIGIGLAILIETLDTRIKSEQDVEDILDIPIIGLVSPINIDKKTSRLKRQTSNIDAV